MRTFAAAMVSLLLSAGGGAEEGDRSGEVFDPAPVLRLEIELSREAMEQLGRNPRGYVRGTVHDGDAVFKDVGIRLKGSAGSFRPLGDKPGFTLKFNQFIPQQKFHGLKKILLNNAAQDPSYLSELVGNQLFREAGVPAQRMGHARVQLNGRDLGLYVVAEAMTTDFLARWFKDTSGNLYEGPGDVNSGELDIDSRGGAGDRSDLRVLNEAAAEPDPANRIQRLGKLLDLERFISFLAMEAITSHWDGYATGVNNYHVYHDPTTDRLVFMPHGTDQLFQQPGAPPQPDSAGLVAKAVLRAPETRRRYQERLRQLLDTVLDVPALEKRIDALSAKLRPFLAEKGRGTAEAQSRAAKEMASRIAQRAAFLRREIEAKRAPVKPSVEFDAQGIARLTGWKEQVREGTPQFQRAGGEGLDGGAALKITAGSKCRASFRVSLVLPVGRYRFQGKVRTESVQLDRGAAEGGAGLRISRGKLQKKVEGTSDWTAVDFEFRVDPGDWQDGDSSMGTAILVCELNARKGTAWFDEKSLALARLPAGAEEKR